MAQQLTPEAFARELGGSVATAPTGPDPDAFAASLGGVSSSLEDTIRKVAEAEGFDADLALAVARKESSLNPSAVGDAGKAIGLFQLHEGAASDVGIADRNDPIQNITGGIRYLKQLSDRYGGDPVKTLMAYNGGMGNVDKGTISTAAQTYAADILAELSQGRRAQAGQRPLPSAPPESDAVAAPLAGAKRIEAGRSQTEDLARSAWGGVKTMASAFDPRTPEGQANLAATAGAMLLSPAAGMTRLVGGRVAAQTGILPTVAKLLGPGIGAAAGGAGAEAVQQTVGTRPSDPSAVTWEGLSQAGMEVIGQIGTGAFRHLAKFPFAHTIGRTARTELGKAQRAATRAFREGFSEAGDLLKQLSSGGADATRAATALAQETSARAGGATARSVQRSLAQVADQELQNLTKLADADRVYQQILGQPVSPVEVATGARGVLAGRPGIKGPEGPAARALRQAGAAVEAAAEKGPDLDFSPVVARANDLSQRFRPTGLFPSEGAAETQRALQAWAPSSGTAVGENFSAALQRIAKEAEEGSVPDLPGFLGMLQRGPEKLSFADMHKVKKILDEVVNWDESATRHLEIITKELRRTVREQMRGFAPYDQASAVYEQVIPLYRKGIGARVINSLAEMGDDDIAKVLKPDRPQDAKALYDLIVEQSAAGGDRAAGQAAWDSIRSAFTYKHLIDGGADGLIDRVRDLATKNPVFAKTVFGDQGGQQVISNLLQIGTAVRMAKQAAETGLRRGKIESQRVTDAIHDTVFSLAESSLAPFMSREAMDVAMANAARAAGAQGTLWGNISTVRLLRGVRGDELIEWAAYSPARTRRMVQVLLSPKIDRAGANFLRSGYAAINRPMPSHAPTPPPE